MTRQLSARFSRALPLFAVLAFACDSTQPFEPSEPENLSVSAARSAPEFPAPGSATVSASSDTQITVGWIDNSTNESSFEIHRSTSGEAGTFSLRATSAANTTRHTDQGLELTSPYCYKVRAVRVVGKKPTTYSAFSNPVCATTTPAAPSNFAAVAAPFSYINLSWQDNSTSETGFQIVRTRSGAANDIIIITTAANTTTYADPAMNTGTQYCYKVAAVRKNLAPDGSATYSYSAYTDSACATVPPQPVPNAPAAASGATASPSSSSSIAVRWTDNSTNEDGFRIYRSVEGGGGWVLAGTSPGSFGNLLLFDDAGRASEQPVCYKVAAFNSGGEAPASNTACATPPAAPTNLAMTRLNEEEVAFSWNDNSGVEDGYELVVRWSQGACCHEGGACDTGVSDGDTLVTRLPSGTTSYRHKPTTGCGYSEYGYYVVATKDGGRSTPSDEVPLP
ncbi:MAG: fibronectin type III domain-containing protein [Gemmatimonadaceae bacterium]|nr:fibronectin type III domain-containing protein [Gemmatimonadaceae bacterium]